MTQGTWRKYTDWPLIAAAFVFLAAYTVQVTRTVSPAQHLLLEAVLWLVWVFFLIDYAANLLLAEQRGRWFLRHLHELVVIVLPVLRPLRLLRLVPLLRVLNRSGGDALRGHIVLYVVVSMTVLGYAGALAVLDAEQDVPGANITTLGDALWWSMTTITSVGYGDYYPVTLTGRLVAAGLMIAGIGVLSAVTAAFASWLVENVSVPAAVKDQSRDRAVNEELRSVSLQLDSLIAQLAGSHRVPGATGAAGTTGAPGALGVPGTTEPDGRNTADPADG
ncbi:potassium channel family protein [Arthrobacter sp. H41]|uniref:potassium channel family protein n=1 Tax=Arthrobacter sp. H41 TaxID=1312978 RepID=UPI0004B89884|nr:potassium channel family protein [Arthrobacter sp. H41]